ncbi:hypothetical protein HHI36_008711 [Cryptolaemus montrouzieri]|uniref:Uncharacterized protein n=1 Tax=Cryptolaemus montrouzieri TaxID=559131 RepID=A0ABD2MTE4_9CUCU
MPLWSPGSAMEYFVWGAAAKCYMRKIENLQKKFKKMIFRKPSTYPSDELYKEANVMDVRQLFFFRCVTETFSKRNRLSYVDHGYQTRYVSRNKAKTTFSSRTISQRSLGFQAYRLYNCASGGKEPPIFEKFKEKYEDLHCKSTKTEDS